MYYTTGPAFVPLLIFPCDSNSSHLQEVVSCCELSHDVNFLLHDLCPSTICLSPLTVFTLGSSWHRLSLAPSTGGSHEEGWIENRSRCWFPYCPTQGSFSAPYLLVSTLLYAQSGRRHMHSAECRHKQILCCSCLDDGSGLVKECWLLSDHLSFTTACQLLSPPPRAAMMDRASISQPSSPLPLLPHRAFVIQAFDGSSRLDTAEKDRRINTEAIVFSDYPLSSFWGHLQFTTRSRGNCRGLVMDAGCLLFSPRCFSLDLWR